MTVAPFCSVFAASPLDESLGGWNYERLLPVLDSVETLREEAQARNPLTVLDMDVFCEGTGQFARVFGSCSSSAGLTTLGDAAYVPAAFFEQGMNDAVSKAHDGVTVELSKPQDTPETQEQAGNG